MLLASGFYRSSRKGGLKADPGLGLEPGLVMDAPHEQDVNDTKGTSMAEEEPLLTNPPTAEVAHHVRDYARFTKLLKWGAIVSLIVAFLVLLIIS